MTQQGDRPSVRVRFAPSPTGELHIGGLRTALISYLFAAKEGGTFLLRIEDTDRTRFVEGAFERQAHDLHWAGVAAGEGVVIADDGSVVQNGAYGPYIQSERLAIYSEHISTLLDNGSAYRCFCTPERLDAMRKEQMARKEAPKYDRTCCALSAQDVARKVADGTPHVIRFKVPAGTTTFDDIVFGRISVDNATIDDQILIKSDGFPTYHFAVVVDDYLMRISHVIRATEWISSTPKHVLLYEALSWKDAMPQFCHVAPILNKSKKKLSKREGSVSVKDFRDLGYPAAALINFIILLGWNPKTTQEIFTMDELIAQFDLAKLNRAGGVFDMDRLNWISRAHIKNMSVAQLYADGMPFLAQQDFFIHADAGKKITEYIMRVLTVEQDRLETYRQIGADNLFFFTEAVAVDKDLLRWKTNTDEQTRVALERAVAVLDAIPDTQWTRDNVAKILLDAAGDKRGDFLWPLRAALTGEKKSPSPSDCAWVLGKEETLQRLRTAQQCF